MKKVKAAFTRKIGPLPAWAWLAILGVVVYAYRSRNSALGTAAASTNATDTTAGQSLGDPLLVPPGSGVYDPNDPAAGILTGGGGSGSSGDESGGSGGGVSGGVGDETAGSTGTDLGPSDIGGGITTNTGPTGPAAPGRVRVPHPNKSHTGDKNRGKRRGKGKTPRRGDKGKTRRRSVGRAVHGLKPRVAAALRNNKGGRTGARKTGKPRVTRPRNVHTHTASNTAPRQRPTRPARQTQPTQTQRVQAKHPVAHAPKPPPTPKHKPAPKRKPPRKKR